MERGNACVHEGVCVCGRKKNLVGPNNRGTIDPDRIEIALGHADVLRKHISDAHHTLFRQM